MPHPQHPKHLVGSKWSARRPEARELHWEAVAFAPKEGLVTLEAVLTKRQRLLPWRALRDRSEWEPGWSSAAEPPRALVVGAGMAGLTCAGELHQAGWRVTVVDKARGAGGRASTRRAGALRFDHGAQYFTARRPSFRRAVQAWAAAGHVAPWEAELVRLGPEGPDSLEGERWVGTPGMSSLVKHLAAEREVRFGARVQELSLQAEGWFAHLADPLSQAPGSGERLGPFDSLVVATPAPQARALLAPCAPGLASRVAQIEVAPCWATLVSFSAPLGLAWEGAQVQGSPLGWVALDSSKPGRPPGNAWVLHASPDWSGEHLELEAEEVTKALLEALAALLEAELPSVDYATSHRWRYARTTRPLGEPFLFDSTLGLGVCGDGCLGERIEGAFLSGLALGTRLLTRSPAISSGETGGPSSR